MGGARLGGVAGGDERREGCLEGGRDDGGVAAVGAVVALLPAQRLPLTRQESST